jgi:glutathione S-transferase
MLSYVLNIKGLPYKTVWLEYPDTENELKKLGVAPTTVRSNGKQVYTVPTIYDPATKRAITDSEPIARYLEEQYPTQSLFFPPRTRALQAAHRAQLRSIGRSVVYPMLVYDQWRTQPPRSQLYIRETREQMFGGKRLEDIAPRGEEREAALRHTKEFFDEVARTIKTNGDDSLFLTEDVISYADVDIASYLMWLRHTDGDNSRDILQAITSSGDGHWIKYLEAFSKFEKVD